MKRNRPLPIFALASAFTSAIAFGANFTTDTAIGISNATYDGQPIIVSGCTLTVDGMHNFASLRVTNNGVVTHSPWSAGVTNNRLLLTMAGDAVVSSGSVIRGNAALIVQGSFNVATNAQVSASGYGYPLGTNAGPGVGGVGAWSGGGASHGGIGGIGPNAAQPGLPYGTVAEPATPGSRGGTTSGSPGGGALRLSVAGTLTVDGRVSADGASAGYESNGGGGSGGSVWINAGALAGAGTISADGGNGDVSYWGGGGGGGGGRLALYCDTGTFTGARHAFGGAGKGAGGAGTVLWKTSAQPYGEVIMDGGGTTTPRTPVDSTLPFSLIVSNGAVVYAAQPLTLSRLRVGSGGMFTQMPGTGAVNLTITGDLIIDAGGSVSADACGYFASTNAGPGAGLSGGGGAGHGGDGGTKYTGVKGGPAYGSILWPTNYGSRGGDGANGSGGAGGGAVQLNVGGALTVNGRLSADGGAVGYESAAGSGSGGGLLVAAQALTGSGVISVAGGVGDSSYWYGGGGGAGGRLALRAASNGFTGVMTASGGAGKGRGGAGTIFTQWAGETFGTVRLDNGAESTYAATTPVLAPQAFHLTISNYIRVTFPQSATLASLTAGPNVWISFPTNGVPLDLVVQSNVLLATGTQILADGYGYPISGDAGFGVGGISNAIGGGAGHGGGGGLGSTGARGGRIYGSATEPATFGSQGGPSAGGGGGSGGGVVRMTVGGTLALQGRLSADGLNAPASNSGGGAGGSIFLTVGALTGNGLLWALGGVGDGPGGGGGGGRISILGDASGFNTNNILVTGGSGYQAGSNGTLYLGGYVAPRVVGHRPTGFVTQPPNGFDADFDQGIDPASFTPDLVQVSGPAGPIPAEQLSVVNAGGRTWRISFPPQTGNGTVRFTIASGVRSLFGLVAATAYSGSFDIHLERYLIPSPAGHSLRLDWATSLGKTYQLQTSTDLGQWIDFGPAWPGTGDMVVTNIPMESTGRTFFRFRLFDN